jgi:hypothetical protein
MLRVFGGGHKPRRAEAVAKTEDRDPMGSGKSADTGSGEAHDRGVAVQACVQCGLSIGEAATFCPVCGTRVGDGVAVATAVEPGAPFAPALESEVGEGFEPLATGPGVSEPGAETLPGQPSAGLVTQLESTTAHASDTESEAAHLDAAPVVGHGAIQDAEPDADHTELVADLAAEHEADADRRVDPEAAAQPEAAVEPEAAAQPEALAEPEESAADLRERRMAEIAALLESGGRCEEADVGRAAVVYGEVIVGCLEVTDDPLGTEPVRRDLLRGFDRLSFVLERQGLPEEALAVVDDAASLGLLDVGGDVAAAQRDALRDRREGLRRILYGDSAQL